MKKIIFAVVCFCVALLPTHILGMDDDMPKPRLKRKLTKIAESGESINNIFKPSKNGFLGDGYSCTAWKGILSIGSPPTNTAVAMKFTFCGRTDHAFAEYGAYTCLNAIGNKSVEAYGIPSVYYFGSWETYTLTAVTLFDSSLKEICEHNHIAKLDFLFICREVVRILKFIHRHGILHYDVQPANIVFRNNRLFLIDFDSSFRFYFYDSFEPSTEMSKWEEETSYAKGIEHTKDDWENFLFHLKQLMENQLILYYAISKISKFEFACSVDQMKLNYNELYERINNEINTINHNGTKIFSWLEDKQGQNDSEQEPIDIYSIEEPLDQVKFRYPKINYTYFGEAGTPSGGNLGTNAPTMNVKSGNARPNEQRTKRTRTDGGESSLSSNTK